MKTFIYTLLLFVLATNIVSASNELNLNSSSISELQIENTPKYKIYSQNKVIYITNIQEGSYVMIFDRLGRNTYKGTIKSSTTSIPAYMTGMYIVRIQKGKTIITDKILVN